MNTLDADIVIVGAGPVGLLCAYLGQMSGLRTIVLDQSEGPLKVGRADALNARTLQLFEIIDLFDDLYPLGKTCNTSSVWAGGQFLSRQSSWWDELEGCLHKHFLMLGQSFLEQCLDKRLSDSGTEVRRLSQVVDVQFTAGDCAVQLANGKTLRSRYLIGADGSRSIVRKLLQVPFEMIRPQIVWAVIDAVIETDFPKVPEIIVFQAETSDVAWIPREGKIDRFYVRMDTKDFDLAQAVEKINRAMHPHTIKLRELVWFSKFSVKESVAERFSVRDRAFLAGDAAHIHSVNGGQGLNTGIGDAFNLMWKLNMVERHGARPELLRSYEEERRPIALSVIATSGELVRATKYSKDGTHAQDYVRIVQKRAGNITGMGIRYGEHGIPGSRLLDMEVFEGNEKSRLYSQLDYAHYSLLLFGQQQVKLKLPDFVKAIQIFPEQRKDGLWTANSPYVNLALLVRPDSYIQAVAPLDQTDALTDITSDKYYE